MASLLVLCARVITALQPPGSHPRLSEIHQAPYGQDLTSMQYSYSLGDRLTVAIRLPMLVPEFHMRTAKPTGIRLSMETAVQRILILCLAFRAHAKYRHRSMPAVVRDFAHNSESGSAICAINK